MQINKCIPKSFTVCSAARWFVWAPTQGLRMRTVKALYDTAVKAKSLKDLIRLISSHALTHSKALVQLDTIRREDLQGSHIGP